MMLRVLIGVWMTLALCAGARAQDPAAFEVLELRVTSSKPRSAIVDRGASDGLEIGDRVLFRPREGNTFDGTVTKVEERSAVVELSDPTLWPAPGTRGEVRIPKSRFEEPPVATPEATPPVPTVDAEHPPWKNTDEEWQSGEPLLAKVRPLRPQERPRTITGRFYTIVDYTRSTEDDRTDGFYRAGASVVYDNLTGRGDRLHVDGELNYRNTDVPDQDDERATRLRLDRLSYETGGTRFADARWEVGRFLQGGMPEFGVLDGFEWEQRASGGNRYGISLGFMPEPDDEQDTGSDAQIAGYYRWVQDESEQLSFAAGYQKTFHDFDADRDLVVANLRYLPLGGWSFNSTAWIDRYGDGDTAKGPGFELTQLYAIASRRWESGSSLAMTYSHIAFPEVDRNEFSPVTDAQLADDHNDRVALNGRQHMSADTSVHSAVGGWVDEDEEGGDADLGVSVDDFAIDRGLLDVGAFGTWGRFTKTKGARVSLGRYTENGRWSVDYEFADHHFDGFSADNDDLPQHRVRASRDVYTASGWSFSGHLEVGLWGSENSITAGFYLQKSF